MATYTLSVSAASTSVISWRLRAEGITKFDKIIVYFKRVTSGTIYTSRTTVTGSWENVGSGDVYNIDRETTGSFVNNTRYMLYAEVYYSNSLLATTDTILVPIGSPSAELSVTNRNHTTVRVEIANLQYFTNQYQKFVLTFRQNDTVILKWEMTVSVDGYNYTGISFTNQYLGFNWFAPGTTYSVSGEAYWQGTGYSLGSVTFTTDSISAPSGTVAPSVYPTVKDQGTFGSCVADTLTSAMEVFHAKAMSIAGSFGNYSVSYFYGCDGDTSEGMDTNAAVQNYAQNVGSCRWELVEPYFPQRLSKSACVTLYNNAVTRARNNATNQRMTGWAHVDFYDTAGVKSAIANNGCFFFSFAVPNNFESGTGSDGIVPQPSGGWRGSYHAMLLIGLTTINGKAHWIAQNSWGTSWGAGGRCYIPYDWGAGVQSPRGPTNTDTPTGWTAECYALYDTSVPTNHPATPIITSAVRAADGLSASVAFSDPSGGGVLVFVRAKGATAWYPKTPTGSQYGYVYSSSPATVQLDSASREYEVSAIAVNGSNLLSLRSATADITDRPSGSGARIYNGGWTAYAPYIWTGSRWSKRRSKIYDGGW